MSQPIRVVLVDDHRMFRSGVRSELAEEAADGIEIVGEAPDVETAVSVIKAEQPDVVILTSADFTRRVADADGRHVPDRDVQLALWADAIRGLRADLADEGIDLGVVLDNPRPDGNPLLCAGESGTAEGCGRSQEAATAKVARHVANERSAVGADRAMDTISLACRDDECPARLDGVWVYSDATHLSRQFTAAHADAVAAFLGRFPALAP